LGKGIAVVGGWLVNQYDRACQAITLSAAMAIKTVANRSRVLWMLGRSCCLVISGTPEHVQKAPVAANAAFISFVR
jgi:hypothetical protein